MAASGVSARRRRGDHPASAPSAPSAASAAVDAAPASASAPPPRMAHYATTPLAVAARNGSPVVLLAALALCFPRLVGSTSGSSSGSTRVAPADGAEAAAAAGGGDTALATLGGLLAVATVVQAAASVVGLPPAGSEEAEVRRRRAKKDVRKPNRIVTTTLSLVLTLLATPLVHAVLVLFGAPFLAQTGRTLLCAAHLAVLGLFPAIYTCGTDGTGAWRALAAGRLRVLDPAVGGLWGACAGAWLGAVPIPLDWDRPWQQWPVTVVVGMYVGHAVGRLVGGAVPQR